LKKRRRVEGKGGFYRRLVYLVNFVGGLAFSEDRKTREKKLRERENHCQISCAGDLVAVRSQARREGGKSVSRRGERRKESVEKGLCPDIIEPRQSKPCTPYS